MPGVIMRFLRRARAAFIAATVVPGFTMTKSLIGSETPGAAPAPSPHVVPLAFERSAGTNTRHVWPLPLASIYRKGFSRIRGADAIVVYGGSGKLCAGALRVPTKTMFQFAPV